MMHISNGTFKTGSILSFYMQLC